MVVVTSPMGLNAPPALDEIMTNPKSNHLVFLSSINLFNIEIITIVVVKLSNTADKKKVITEISQINFVLLVVFILSVMF